MSKQSGKAAKADNYPLTDLGAFRMMRVLWISSDRHLLLPQSGVGSILAEEEIRSMGLESASQVVSD